MRDRPVETAEKNEKFLKNMASESKTRKALFCRWIGEWVASLVCNDFTVVPFLRTIEVKGETGRKKKGLEGYNRGHHRNRSQAPAGQRNCQAGFQRRDRNLFVAASMALAEWIELAPASANVTAMSQSHQESVFSLFLSWWDGRKYGVSSRFLLFFGNP